MRAIIGVAVVVTIVAGLATYSPSQGPPIAREFSHDEMKSLQQEYVMLAERRVTQMTAKELKDGIVELRRQCLMAELVHLSQYAEDNSFEETRAGIAAGVLATKSREELKEGLRSLMESLKE